MKKIIFLFVVLSLWMLGCGSKDTSGTLTLSDITLTDLTAGRFKVDAVATYVPDAGKEATNAVIDFTAVYTTPSNVQPEIKTLSYRLSRTGIATYTYPVIQANEQIYLTLTASMGGLSQTKYVTIPAIDVFNTTPSKVSFIQIDPVGGQADISVLLSGGAPPYKVLKNDKSSEISATLLGTSLNISKNIASGTTSVATFVDIILVDGTGALATLRVNYFK